VRIDTDLYSLALKSTAVAKSIAERLTATEILHKVLRIHMKYVLGSADALTAETINALRDKLDNTSGGKAFARTLEWIKGELAR
jgi:DNA-binding transcriptional regulator YiaG